MIAGVFCTRVFIVYRTSCTYFVRSTKAHTEATHRVVVSCLVLCVLWCSDNPSHSSANQIGGGFAACLLRTLVNKSEKNV